MKRISIGGLIGAPFGDKYRWDTIGPLQKYPAEYHVNGAIGGAYEFKRGNSFGVSQGTLAAVTLTHVFQEYQLGQAVYFKKWNPKERWVKIGRIIARTEVITLIRLSKDIDFKKTYDVAEDLEPYYQQQVEIRTWQTFRDKTREKRDVGIFQDVYLKLGAFQVTFGAGETILGAPGDSGGPVFDKDKKVILGMIKGGGNGFVICKPTALYMKLGFEKDLKVYKKD